MGNKVESTLDQMFYRRALRRWTRLADRAGEIGLGELKTLRGNSRAMRRQIDRLLHVAEGRLAATATGGLRKPASADWSWRPAPWAGPLPVPGLSPVETGTALCDGATVFHDCALSEMTLRQIRNHREEHLAPYGLRMDVFRFDGSFLSLAVELPAAAVEGLRLRHLIRLDTIVECEKPIEIFARLNVKHGPNTEQLVRELPLHEPEVMVEFDLAYTKLNEKRVERMWVDLIFEGPEMNQVTLRDVTFCRRPRAEL